MRLPQNAAGKSFCLLLAAGKILKKQGVSRSAFTPKSFGWKIFGVGRVRQFLLWRLAKKLAHAGKRRETPCFLI
jgi:hypothetical protein